jgi:hypothetical protein
LGKLNIATTEEITINKIKAPMFLKWIENV